MEEIRRRIEEEKRVFDKAKKIADWDDWFYIEGGIGYSDGFFQEIEDLAEAIYEWAYDNQDDYKKGLIPIPTYAWTTWRCHGSYPSAIEILLKYETEDFRCGAEKIIENIISEFPEESSLEVQDFKLKQELETALTTFYSSKHETQDLIDLDKFFIQFKEANNNKYYVEPNYRLAWVFPPDILEEITPNEIKN